MSSNLYTYYTVICTLRKGNEINMDHIP